MDDEEVRVLQHIKRVVGYELTSSGRVEYSCLDSDGDEVTLDRRDLMDGGEVEELVRQFEERYPPPWTKGKKSPTAASAGERRKWQV